MGGVDFLDSLIALYIGSRRRYVLENGSTDFCVTSSIWLWYSAGYDTKNINHRWA